MAAGSEISCCASGVPAHRIQSTARTSLAAYMSSTKRSTSGWYSYQGIWMTPAASASPPRERPTGAWAANISVYRARTHMLAFEILTRDPASFVRDGAGCREGDGCLDRLDLVNILVLGRHALNDGD